MSNDLNGKHLAVWNKLNNLKAGERVLGRELTEIAQIESERKFHAIIEDLRTAGYPIDASKSSYDAGYFPLKEDFEVIEYLFKKTDEYEGEIEKREKDARVYFSKKYGEGFDFTKYKNEMELKRNDSI